MLKELLLNSKFWFLVYAIAQLVVIQIAPNFNPDLLKAIDALVVFVIGFFTVPQAAAYLRGD